MTASASLPEVTISESRGIRYLHLGTPWIQGAMRIEAPLAIERELEIVVGRRVASPAAQTLRRIFGALRLAMSDHAPRYPHASADWMGFGLDQALRMEVGGKPHFGGLVRGEAGLDRGENRRRERQKGARIDAGHLLGRRCAEPSGGFAR